MIRFAKGVLQQVIEFKPSTVINTKAEGGLDLDDSDYLNFSGSMGKQNNYLDNAGYNIL